MRNLSFSGIQFCLIGTFISECLRTIYSPGIDNDSRQRYKNFSAVNVAKYLFVRSGLNAVFLDSIICFFSISYDDNKSNKYVYVKN
jgi:hypothetical protein